MSLFVHGCTAQAFEAIKAKQGKNELPTPWEPSDCDGMTYFYSVQKIEDSGEAEDSKAALDYAITAALEQADLQALFNDDTRVYAIVLDIPDHAVEDDNSCPNMAGLASCIPCEDFHNYAIVGVYERKISPYAKPIILSRVIGNTYFKGYDLDSMLSHVAQELANSGAYIEYEPEDYKEITL